jgi:hypothetical protein
VVAKPGNNGHGKPFSFGDFHRESLGLGIAELASGVTSLGVVAYADDVIPIVNQEVSKFVADRIILPHLDTIERTKKLCKLKDCQVDTSKPREERARELAHTLVLFGESWVISFLVKIAARVMLNKWFDVKHPEEPRNGKWLHDKVLYRKLNRHDWDVILWDEGVHLGAFVVGNFAMAKHTDKVIDGMSGMLQKVLGWGETRAHNVASMFMIWELPNLAGLGAGVKRIHSYHKNKALEGVFKDGNSLN